MKKYISVLLCFCIIVSALTLPCLAQSQQTIKVIVSPQITLNWNGEIFYPTEADGSIVYPITYNNRTYLPARFIAERCGVTVNWDPKTQTVMFNTGGKVILNNGKAPQTTKNQYAGIGVLNPQIALSWNGELFQPKEADGTNIYPIVYNGRTFLPSRLVAEKAGVSVLWDGESQTVIFSTQISGTPDKDGQNSGNNNQQTNANDKDKYYTSSDGRFSTKLWAADCLINGERVSIPISYCDEMLSEWQIILMTDELKIQTFISFSDRSKVGKTYTLEDTTNGNPDKPSIWELSIYDDKYYFTIMPDRQIKDPILRLDEFNSYGELCTGYISYKFTQSDGTKIDFEGYFAVIVGCKAPSKNTGKNTSSSNTSYTSSNVVPIIPPIIRIDDKICPDCNGTGRKTCSICHGTGDSNSNFILGCPACMGYGSQLCRRCGGDGYSMW